MTAKRTMTLNLTDAEMRVLDDLSARKEHHENCGAPGRRCASINRGGSASKRAKNFCLRTRRPRRRLN